MPLDLAAIQDALRAGGLDGWLLYDFHGSNPIAGQLTGVAGRGHMTTRRWYYLIPAQGMPRGLVHAIERHNLEHLPGETTVYAGRLQLEAGLDRLLAGLRRVAMDYSPMCAIPYLSRVDAGTAEAVRARGVEILSSGDLVQQFEARWTPAQLASHQAAADALYRIKDRAFDEAARALRSGRTLSEYDLQQRMAGWFDEEGLVSDSPPVVAIGANAGNPHYLPTADAARPIVRDEVLLLDLWAKQQSVQGAVFADITWVSVTGSRASAEVDAAFRAVADARDAAVALVAAAAHTAASTRRWFAVGSSRTVWATTTVGTRSA